MSTPQRTESDFYSARLVRSLPVSFHAMRQGKDWLVMVAGGDTPHIGAVALAADGELRSFARPTHKEEEVARQVAEDMARGTASAVCVSCGIHFDGITRAEIEAVLAAVRELTAEWAAVHAGG